MADNNYRSYRGRDPLAPGSTDAPARGPADDPLAELARLIGQSNPMTDSTRNARRGPPAPLHETAPGGSLDWGTDDRYAAEDDLLEERYDPPRVADPYPAYRPAPSRDAGGYEPPAASQFPAPAPRLNGAREDARGFAGKEPRYRDEQEPSHDRQIPAFLPPARDERYEYGDEPREASDDQYDIEDYEEEAPTSRRRGGFVVIVAVLSLAVLGTAGAFAYRAMFGGAMLPSRPPIIKAEDGPNRIVPSAANSPGGTTDQANANSGGSAEKLVPREEKPVAVPPPVNAGPRVVSTIPIFPSPTAGPTTGPSAGPPGALPPGSVAAGTPAPTFPAPAAPVPAAPAGGAPDQLTAPASPSQPSVGGLAGPKKIHTVAIRPDQMGGTDAAPARPAAAAAPRPVPPAQAGGNAPLSIVPQGDTTPSQPPARTHTAVARPIASSPPAGAEPAAAAGGGYSVQVSSQRSEAEAQTAFRALQAKYPNQLGGHQPIVRRADLGDKGVYYRALVGPFASMEQAAAVCSNLKAAGGNCIVQRN